MPLVQIYMNISTLRDLFLILQRSSLPWLVTAFSVSLVCWDFLWADIRMSVTRSTTTELCSPLSSSRLTTNSVTWYKQEVMSDNRRNFSSKQRNLPSIEVTKIGQSILFTTECFVFETFMWNTSLVYKILKNKKKLNCA